MDRLDFVRFTVDMLTRLVTVLTPVTAVGCGVSGGVLFAFSTFVMRALDDRPPGEAIAAMQAINRFAPNPAFMLALLGSAGLSAGLVAASIGRRAEPGTAWRVAGAGCYLVGIALTAAYHVPRNDALAHLDPAALDAARRWTAYARPWTLLNHVRTTTSIAAAALLTVATRIDAGRPG